MIKLLDIAKYFLGKGEIPTDGTLADFTMGNGNDTLFLCSLVPEGSVYAFDIQPEAVENTRARLEENGVNNAELILDSHANAGNYIKTLIHGGMFNLGYRPGGDKNVHTMHESTLKAVETAMGLLAPGAVLVVSVYPGHSEGRTEGEMLTERLAACDKKEYNVAVYRLINAEDSPFIIAIQKNKVKAGGNAK